MGMDQDVTDAAQAKADLAARVERETGYWEGVVQESARLQQRFHHVFDCPNVQWAEERHRAAIRAAVKGRVVLDYGCGDGASSAQLLADGAGFVHGVDLHLRNPVAAAASPQAKA